jgi:hypothetical protein
MDSLLMDDNALDNFSSLSINNSRNNEYPTVTLLERNNSRNNEYPISTSTALVPYRIISHPGEIIDLGMPSD